jgi:hypothetical protein
MQVPPLVCLVYPVLQTQARSHLIMQTSYCDLLQKLWQAEAQSANTSFSGHVGSTHWKNIKLCNFSKPRQEKLLITSSAFFLRQLFFKLCFRLSPQSKIYWFEKFETWKLGYNLLFTMDTLIVIFVLDLCWVV